MSPADTKLPLMPPTLEQKPVNADVGTEAVAGFRLLVNALRYRA